MKAQSSMSEIGLWVFGYGSLMWNPGFPYAVRELAELRGFRRSFCMTSVHYRGTEDAPGLVLALDEAPDARCSGVAFGIGADDADEALAGIRERELISYAYREARVPLTLGSGQSVSAVTYVVERGHKQYSGDLDLHQQADIIARAVGNRGPNRDYLVNTASHLRELGLVDPDLEWLVSRVDALSAGDG